MQQGLECSSDKSRLDVGLIHDVLKGTYWSPGIPRETVERAIQGSECFGLYRAGKQIGFARLITDQATFAYLADVFIVESERGQGRGRALIAHVVEEASRWGLRRFLLATADAHALYAPFGFSPLGRPENFMEIVNKNAYGGSFVPAASAR